MVDKDPIVNEPDSPRFPVVETDFERTPLKRKVACAPLYLKVSIVGFVIDASERYELIWVGLRLFVFAIILSVPPLYQITPWLLVVTSIEVFTFAVTIKKVKLVLNEEPRNEDVTILCAPSNLRIG